MHNDYYYLNTHRRMKEIGEIIDLAESGKNFYTSHKVTDSLVKIDNHLDKMEVEARKILKSSK